MAKVATQSRPRDQRGNGEQQLTVQQEREQKVKRFTGFVEVLQPQMSEAMAKGVDFPKLKRIAVMAVTKNPDLLECSLPSWTTALMQCAQDGLMPDGREAAFVPFKGEVVYMPMVYGLRKKILQSGEIRDIFTAVVFEREFQEGLFEVTLGTDPKIVHKPLLGNADRGDMIAAYSVATYKDGTRSFEVMTGAEIARVRAVSRSQNKPDSPWNTFEGEMWRKTVLRRHSKALPMSSDIRDVEAEAMFGPGFEAALRQRREDRTLKSGDRTLQLPASETRSQLDDIEARAGAKVEVEHNDDGEVRPNDSSAGGNGSPDPADEAATTPGATESGASDGEPESTSSDSGDGIDWDGWLTRFRDELPNINNLKALKSWKAPDGIPDDHLADARTLLDKRIAELDRPAPTAAPPAEERDIEAETKRADEIVDVWSSKDLLMDLRTAKTEREAEINAMSDENKSRVWAAYDKREEQLSRKPTR